MKSQDAPINEDLLIRYLTAEATAEERLQVEQWLAGNEANRNMLTQYRLILDESKALNLGRHADVEKAWAAFKLRINPAIDRVTPEKIFPAWLNVAAAVLIVCSIGIWFYLLSSRQHDLTEFSATDQSRSDSLQDGSIITLNKNSSLMYKAGRREVTLRGEAFFNVAHDDKHPFMVKVNDIVVNVLGTSFNIRSAGDQTEIVVASGIVGVVRGNQAIRLYSGEKLRIRSGNAPWKKETDSGFDLNQYPGLVKAILDDPNKWPGLLRFYFAKNDTTSVNGKERAIIRHIILEMVQQKIITGGGIKSFRLNDTALIVSDKKQPLAVYRHFKDKYLKEPGYTIYFGGSPKDGKGIYFKPDSL